MREKTGMSYRDLCKAMRVPWSNFSRWRGRIQRGMVVVKRPGPKKVEPFDPAALPAGSAKLKHIIFAAPDVDASVFEIIRSNLLAKRHNLAVWLRD